ncbi:hypothetical protein_gp119 [Bacillus phage vB_BceM_WH1]|nr:hypothetical protein_gp119 [Bacillus phage vB_BceM_WH1]
MAVKNIVQGMENVVKKINPKQMGAFEQLGVNADSVKQFKGISGSLKQSGRGPVDYMNPGKKGAHYSKAFKDAILPSGSVRSDKSPNALWQTASNTRDMMLEKEGRTFWGALGRDALHGAATGGVVGGTSSALQGGDFWDGAKSGAFNGAAGWGAYRMGMRSVGATSINPLGKNGIYKEAKKMQQALSGDKAVSKQVLSLLNNQQQAGIARTMLQGGYKIPTS